MNINKDDEIDGFCDVKSLDGENGKRAFDVDPRGKEKNPSSDVNEKCSYSVIEAGSYYLGPVVRKCIRTSVTQCLARKKGTDEYYLMKILILEDGNLKDKFHLHFRTIFHSEYTVLSLLKGHPGVIQVYDFFKDCVPDECRDERELGCMQLKRMCMVLECLIPHGCHNEELTPLFQYLKERRLCETEALHIFINILLVVEDLHKKNIVHRDLKLSNIILNRKTLQVKLINFYYANLLSFDSEITADQRGIPPDTSPEALAEEPVAPKPCDMWSTGIILYTMLHGYLPFIGNSNWGSMIASTRSLADVYSEIISIDYSISDNICISDGSKDLIRGLLCKNSFSRLKANEAVDMVCTLLAMQSSSHNRKLLGNSQHSDQIVPECSNFEKSERSSCSCTERWVLVNANVPSATSKTFKIAVSEVETSGGRTRNEEEAVHGEDQPPACGRWKTSLSSRRTSMSRNNKIKFAMLRLGATSVNSIAALSFNYSDRSSSRSQM